jgi:O-methyltransferase involved in polyketide biosynthesis
MASNNDTGSIADASKPNAGRIYDYLLGGNHNFEIDRQSAEQLLQALPQARLLVRSVRWFLGEAVYRLVDQGYDKFIDFASGLPTEDHIHQIAPAETKVIYSDLDPVTVAYAQEIIKNNPNVWYVECDVRKPETLLNSGIPVQAFGNEKKVAIGLNGIAWFISNEAVSHCVDTLYDWADEGSRLFISDVNIEEKTDFVMNVVNFYESVGQPLHTRTKDTLTELLGKWKLEEPGFLPLEEWIGMDEIRRRTQEEHWEPVDVYGGFFRK